MLVSDFNSSPIYNNAIALPLAINLDRWVGLIGFDSRLASIVGDWEPGIGDEIQRNSQIPIPDP